MTRITVVIEDHAEGIHLGQQLAGGRVVTAMQGDHGGLLEAAEETMNHFEGWAAEVGVDDIDERRLPWVAPLRAAITKARGQ